MTELYFAYGSNMNKNRMSQRGIEFNNQKLGILIDYKLVFQEFIQEKEINNIFANIVPDKDSKVEGIIYEVNNMKDLDYYEYVPRDYLRKKISVQTDTGIIECNIYIGNKKNIGIEKKPQKDYLDNFLKNNLLSKKYINFLKTFY